MLRLRLLFIVIATFVSTAIINEAQSTNQENFVKEIGNAISSLIAPGKDLSSKQREDGFRKILKEKFNLPSISKFVLAKYKKDATDEEMKEFTRLFEEIIVETFSDQFKDYSGATLEVTGSKPGNDGAIIVSSKVLGPKPLLVDWLIREKNGKLLVYDIIVEHVSIGMTKRSEFAPVLCEKGVTGLNQALSEKINRNKN